MAVNVLMVALMQLPLQLWSAAYHTRPLIPAMKGYSPVILPFYFIQLMQFHFLLNTPKPNK